MPLLEYSLSYLNSNMPWLLYTVRPFNSTQTNFLYILIILSLFPVNLATFLVSKLLSAEFPTCQKFLHSGYCHIGLSVWYECFVF